MPALKIHPTAIIDVTAELDSSVEIGPYSIVGANVKIDAGTRVAGHVIINGPTVIGKNNHIFQYSSLGEAPQDKKYKDEPTLLEIGDNNTIREFCTFNRGTIQDKGTTKIGNDNWIMAYVHIAHDCQIGNHTIFANNTSLAGHVDIDDYAILGGFTLIHQFCKVGSHVITAVGSVVFKDIPPYVTAAGYDAKPHGINAEGLKRRGFNTESILQIKRAYKALYRNGLTLDEAKIELAAMQKTTPEIGLLTDFLKISTRGIVR
ncbi:acyl-ACP--UDP-N-acetylglucosamine O-acyltransferase [Methylotenera sp.]|uniref:acyl-ACP--UDP-N-acetylglucosamine O-acyltransferase n=1 Tax=Methylotenera sp. TaxID=2051956 RepID=UPI002723D2F6|nr:acyl-ACP--UDP-N-acetylglucosamine O-acyltransferase [Methylotenera sp.]MDO9204670.1 acyl-ACP--UDP-N-acetylglucosamine O-acyltransferase [Methylotenera sp.]MDP1522872.1 acyl-ACP--UDP-N-acetylglucosamine O-acyltransferase [Methylotenera sp.]MDP3307132.1 acyl-ACP--UDP-N-acetylglucosamine O-acyltransferase [Methylotenera sp.]MDP3817970.1 acyl-ACP--UDP-N-acetylglucosamine O-acyltransferase [Methylotenera sp.]MDZ4212859.1 acyl-ACP--UDP-N-acetylglucosamine O-acyltransferase [Methylotenera sp.]